MAYGRISVTVRKISQAVHVGCAACCVRVRLLLIAAPRSAERSGATPDFTPSSWLAHQRRARPTVKICKAEVDIDAVDPA